MKAQTQVDLLRRFATLREQRTTTLAERPYRQPARVYTDPERTEAELHTVLRSQPALVALGCDLPAPGTHYATEAAGVPLLLVRGEDGVVRGLLNICRHRGGRVASGRGCPGRAFKCPYHSWAYDLDGRLLGQPMAMDGFAGLDRADLGLLPVPVAERHGLVFARVDGVGTDDPGPDLADALGDLGPELADYDLAGFEPFGERSRVLDANWKLLYDTFLESYHIFSLHKESLGGRLLSTPLVCDRFGRHARAVIMNPRVSSTLERDESEWSLRRDATIVYTLFPNALLNFAQSGHLDRWAIEPDGASPDRARATLTMYVPSARASEREFWEANLALTEQVVFEEDFSQQEDIHRSLRTGLMPELVFGRNEPVLIRQHELIEELLGG